jgi:hypothetical protein
MKGRQGSHLSKSMYNRVRSVPRHSEIQLAEEIVSCNTVQVKLGCVRGLHPYFNALQISGRDGGTLWN